MPAPILPPGPERPCTHGGIHPHGHRVRYSHDRCRCAACRTAQREYQAQMRRARAYGVPSDLVSADPSRAHVAYLRANGMGLERISKLSGVASSALQRLVYGDKRGVRARNVRRLTERRLLAVTPEPVLVPAVGTRRRVQALVYQGWTLNRIAAHLNVAATNLRRSINGDLVTRHTAEQVAKVYDALWNLTPPVANVAEAEGSRRARNLARARGWAPPLAWDDDTIDDPSAVPNIGPVEDRKGGRPGIDLDELEYLLSAGESLHQAAAQMRATPTAIAMAARRAGRHELSNRYAALIERDWSKARAS